MKHALIRSFRTLCAALLAITASTTCMALPNGGKVPILTYHSWEIGMPCDYSHDVSAALAQDLETIRSQGFVVVPVYWIAEWIAGIRDGSTLPDKVVGITFDDGHSRDWFDDSASPCGYAKSFRTILQEFKAAHPDLPWYSPHAASFVVASPQARARVGGSTMTDGWWGAANTSGIMEIYNHSADHDHSAVVGPVWDPALNIWIPVGGSGDGNWTGQMNFFRIDSYWESHHEVSRAALYISSKIAPAWPDLFAYPFEHASDYLKNDYFPRYGSEHHTLAAFCGSNRPALRSSPRYCIPRYVFNGGWNSTAGLIAILQAAR